MPTQILAGTIEKISTRADNTISVHLSTQELDDAQAGMLMGFRKKFVKVLITDKEAIQSETQKIVEETPLHSSTKPRSMSQKLRDKLWVRWKEGQFTGEFNDYYNLEMEKIIASV